MRRTIALRARTPLRQFDASTVHSLVYKHLVPRIVEKRPDLSHLVERAAGLTTGTTVDEPSANRMMIDFGKFSTGRGFLDDAGLAKLSQFFRPEFGSLRSPLAMRKLLEAAGFVEENDNIHRLLATTKLELPASVHGHVNDHLSPLDPFDRFRVSTNANIYAIDSATTSEVDDAIGFSVDADGREWITVYVADATAYVPFDSDLETQSGRTSGTTVYLPEGVFFMLPRPIIDAATLKPGARCRTFDIKFRVDDRGAVVDYSVGVGFTEHLQRITYDTCQDVLTAAGTSPPSSSPSWVTPEDCRIMKRLQTIGGRLASRQAASIANLPDPYIKVDLPSKKVVKVSDDTSPCVDAYNLVACFMIAANEVCSRIAQENNVPIPFRGTRPLSTLHQAAREFRQPSGRWSAEGDAEVDEASPAGKFARSLMHGLESLRGVSRALYHHTPIYHAGLQTSDYCHSTSPLRRYADMMVHHQLKAWLARARYRASLLVPIEEFHMAELCQHTSQLALAADLMQTSSQRFWLLSYLKENFFNRDGEGGAASGPKLLEGVVGFTQIVEECPDEIRRHASRFRFRSDIYLETPPMLHTVYHNDASVRVGSVLKLAIRSIEPAINHLQLQLVAVKSFADGPGGDEVIDRVAKIAIPAE